MELGFQQIKSTNIGGISTDSDHIHKGIDFLLLTSQWLAALFCLSVSHMQYMYSCMALIMPFRIICTWYRTLVTTYSKVTKMEKCIWSV